MKTFILLTFGFLGFAFYEMSGGSDFEPSTARLDASVSQEVEVEQVAQIVTEPPASLAIENTEPLTEIESTPSVTRVALNLTTVADAEETIPAEAPVNALIIDSSDTPQIILPSMIDTTTTSGDSFDADVRIVSGNRVNVRGGPSTNYGVVNKLTRGAEVRIIEDNGGGWVRMQPLDGGEAGWMADFLLTSG